MRVKNNNINGLTGIVGKLCFYEVKGQLVCRGVPLSNKAKASAAQIAYRKVFASQVGIAQSVKSTLLHRVWRYTDFPLGVNSQNHFLKINKGAFGRTDRIKYPQLFIVSEGELNPALNFEIRRDGNTEVMQWDPADQNSQSSPDDRLNVVFLYNEKELKVIKTDVFRSAGIARIAIPVPDLTQQEGYVFWSSFDDKRFSPSVYWKG